jgi:hypothetical protein
MGNVKKVYHNEIDAVNMRIVLIATIIQRKNEND